MNPWNCSHFLLPLVGGSPAGKECTWKTYFLTRGHDQAFHSRMEKCHFSVGIAVVGLCAGRGGNKRTSTRDCGRTPLERRHDQFEDEKPLSYLGEESTWSDLDEPT